ncbi:MAG: sugar phosphate nucleotidyltransferase [Candidatus Heimdallarchaeota archaeon]
MIVIIIAAGKGKRMRPLTETRLKGSLPIQNRSILLRLADMTEKAGIMDKLVLVISPGQEEEIREMFANESYYGKLSIAIQDPPKGTADAVAQAEQFVTDEKQCLIMNGDIFANLDIDLPNQMEHHKKMKAVCTYLVFPGKNERYGLLSVSDDGLVLDFQEKTSNKEMNENIGYINAGVYFTDIAIFDAIRETPLSKRGEYEFPDSITILGKKGPIAAYITNKWISLENPLDLLNAQVIPEPSTIQTSMQFHSGGEIGFKAAEELFIEEGVTIEFSSVKFIGPVLVGKGSLIVTGSEIGPNVYLGDNCEIGAGSVLKNTILMEHCCIGENCKINNVVSAEDILVVDGTEIYTKIDQNKELQLEDLIIIGGHAVFAEKLKIDFATKIDSYTVIKSLKDLNKEP